MKTTRMTSRELVAHYVRRRILAGEFEPGRKLNVAEFAEQIGVSHTPTREAFQLLASEGLVRISAYRGAYVADLSPNEYEEVFLMRAGLEELAAELGAQLIDDAGAALARDAIFRMDQAASQGDVEGFLAADHDFHRIHYEASGRPRLWERIESLRSAAERYIRLGYQLPEVDMSGTVRGHKVILDAIDARDGSAARIAIREDLQRTYATVRAQLLAGAPATAGARM